MNFLLWNVDRNELGTEVAELVDAHEIDVVFLVEPPENESLILEELHQVDAKFHGLPSLIPHHLRVFSRTDSVEVEALLTDSPQRFEFRRIFIQGESFLFAVGHGIDKGRSRESDRAASFGRFMDKLRMLEEEHEIDHTVITGDLNLDPYEAAMTTACGLHATMDRTIAEKGDRVVQNEKWNFFYNPMWNYFGDQSAGPPGTYFYPMSNWDSLGWHMLDQVLIKGRFAAWLNRVEILRETSSVSLQTNKGRPRKKKYSDHFPVKFSITRPAIDHEQI